MVLCINLSKLIEKHAPLQTCRIADGPLVPSDGSVNGSGVTRHFKHIVKSMTQCAKVKRTTTKVKPDYYTSEIEQCECDNRRLYRLLNRLLQPKKSHYLPVNNNIHELASRFSTFFSGKIETIRIAFQSHYTITASSTTDHHPAPWLSRLELFATATISDIDSLLIKSPITSCVLDPLPAWLLEDVSDNVVPFLKQLFDYSIASGVVPCCLPETRQCHSCA